MNVEEPYKPKRKALIIASCACAGTSIALFFFRPIPPVGLVAAAELALVTPVLLLRAFLPQHVDRMRKRMNRALEKEPRTNIGQWVP
jgi:hypothetical protein